MSYFPKSDTFLPISLLNDSVQPIFPNLFHLIWSSCYNTIIIMDRIYFMFIENHQSSLTSSDHNLHMFHFSPLAAKLPEPEPISEQPSRFWRWRFWRGWCRRSSGWRGRSGRRRRNQRSWSWRWIKVIWTNQISIWFHLMSSITNFNYSSFFVAIMDP